MQQRRSAAKSSTAARATHAAKQRCVRAAAFAGAAYPDEPAVLRRYLDQFLPRPVDGVPAAKRGPRSSRRLLAVISPHIDFHRGGHAYAPGYRQIAARCDGDLFVVFGTAHQPMRGLFALTRQDYATPLGVVETDRAFVDRLAADLDGSLAGRLVEPFRDEPVHRREHSIEFQAVFLRHALAGRRRVRIVPILVGSFDEFFGRSPAESLEVQAFLAALRTAIAACRRNVCLIAAADLAHVGPQFGDPRPVTKRQLTGLARDDQQLLDAICRRRPDEFFARVARDGDRNRICGLSPIYLMLALLESGRGRLLAYDQAVAVDGSACVSFASAAFDAPVSLPPRRS